MPYEHDARHVIAYRVRLSHAYHDSQIFGRKPLWLALGYGVFLAVGFFLSPAVTVLGIGFMGKNMPGMPVTVVLAHLAYAGLLGVLTRRWLRDSRWLLAPQSC